LLLGKAGGFFYDGVMNREAHPPLNPANAPPRTLPWPDGPLVAQAGAVVRALQEAGHEAYFVGGAVRNWALGLPLKDIDIATSAPPEAVAALFDESRSVGAHFGVMLVHREAFTFEVATFRAEGSYVDHRRPGEVRYGSLGEDYVRRDFTVNAMYYDPVAARLIDPAGGQADLARRLLRAVGDPDRRFAEDALRLLRAVRFAVRYDLEIEPATAEALRAHAPTLREISLERIADELVRILTGPHPGRAMRLMDELGLWPGVIPEIEPMHGCQQPPNFHPEGDVFVHTALVLDHLALAWPGEPPAELALGALLHDVGKPPTFEEDGDRIRFPEHQRVGAEMADRIGRRLRLSNRLRETVVELVGDHMRFMDAPRMKRSTLRRFLGRPDFDLHLALHQADCLASHGNLDNYYFCIELRKKIAEEDRQAALLPPPLIGGRDLIALGLKPGPTFKKLLDAAREEQLEGKLHTREEALAWIKEQSAEGGARRAE